MVLAVPISHTSTPNIDFCQFLYISLFHSIIFFYILPSILLIPVGVELPLCVVIILS